MKHLFLFVFGLWLAIVLTANSPAFAQGQPSGQKAAPAVPSAGLPTTLEADAREVREQLRALLMKYPPDLGRILKLDPTLLQNQAYLAQYPALTAFLSAHPAVAHNPDYYLEFVRQSYDYTEPADPNRQALAMWNNFLEGIAVFFIMVFVGSMLAWLVRTVLNHRRWLRTSRIQNEVHNKLLDRFAGTGDLLAYVQSHAGRRFLEAAPIPLENAPRAGAAPLNRILWSIQIGVVLAVGGLGFQFVSGRVIEQVAEGLWMIGVLAIAFGVGFILSGVISYVLSRRLGLMDVTAPLVPSDRGDATGA